MAYLNVQTQQHSMKYPMSRRVRHHRVLHPGNKIPYRRSQGFLLAKPRPEFEGLGKKKHKSLFKKLTHAALTPIKAVVKPVSSLVSSAAKITMMPLKYAGAAAGLVAHTLQKPLTSMAQHQKAQKIKAQQKASLKDIRTRAQMLAQSTSAESEAARTQQAAQAAADRAAAAQTAADQLQSQVESGQATQAQADAAARMAADAASAAAAYPVQGSGGYPSTPSAMIPAGSTPSATAESYYDAGADIETPEYSTGDDIESMAPEAGSDEALDYTADESGGEGAVQVMDEWGEGGDETMEGLGVLRHRGYRATHGGSPVASHKKEHAAGARHYQRVLTPAQQSYVDTFKHPGERHGEFVKRMKAEGKSLKSIVQSMPVSPPPPPPTVGEYEFEGMGLSKKGGMWLKNIAIGGAIVGGGYLAGTALLSYLNKGGAAKVPVATPDGTKQGDVSIANGMLQAAPAVVQSVLAAKGINPAQASPTDALNAVADIKAGHSGGAMLGGMFGGDMMTYMLLGSAAFAVYYFFFAKKRRS